MLFDQLLFRFQLISLVDVEPVACEEMHTENQK